MFLFSVNLCKIKVRNLESLLSYGVIRGYSDNWLGLIFLINSSQVYKCLVYFKTYPTTKYWHYMCAILHKTQNQWQTLSTEGTWL